LPETQNGLAADYFNYLVNIGMFDKMKTPVTVEKKISRLIISAWTLISRV
jgi:hypothetical protein